MARIYLGVLLLGMALGQILSLDRFIEAVKTYDLGPHGWGAGLAVAMIIAEAVAGLGLLLPGEGRTPAAWIATAVALTWSALAFQGFARGLAVPNCGCFGRFLSQELRWWVLLEDVYFVALAGVVVASVRRGRAATSQGVAEPAHNGGR